MRKLLIGIITTVVLGLTMGCEEEYIKYSENAYVMFADTMSVCPALASNSDFPITISSFNSCPYDRTYAIESISSKSNAVYMHHYSLSSNSITIPAGETSASVTLTPIYENIGWKDSLVVQFRLISSLNDQWSEEGNLTKIEFKKVCPFDVNDFVGYVNMNSAFLREFTINAKRSFKCELVDAEKKIFVFRDFLFDGYDLKVRFNDSNPLDLILELEDPRQQIADARDIFGLIYGDNRIWTQDVPGYGNLSEYNSCNRTAQIILFMNIDGKGLPNNGQMGAYRHTLEWVDKAQTY